MVLLLRLLSLISLVPLLMRRLLSLVPRLMLLLLRLMRGLISLVPRLILLLLRLMLRLPLIRRATFTVALAASATSAASTSPVPPAMAAASGFKTSGQDMAAVGPVKAPVELFHADETTLPVAQTEIHFQSKVPFLGNISRGETIQNPTANRLLGDLNTVILHIKG